MCEITLREFRETDLEEAESILESAWNYRKVCSEEIAKKVSKAFLYGCLANQTFAKVAVWQGRVVGIIMAKKVKGFRRPRKYRRKELLYTADLLRTREGREAAFLFLSDHRINDRLLKRSGRQYQAELALFAVSNEAQGKGVGKRLFSSALDYMKKQGVEQYYLFTDTTCNYQFYDARGMIQRCRESESFQIKGKRQKETFFLYESEI